jgi:hypothetical protein
VSAWLRGAALVGLGVLAFAATGAAIRAQLPWPAEGALDARWRHLRAHADEFDLVFVGSSNLARGIDPVAVDRELARLGHPIRSYNLGADNMQSTEVGYVLRQIVALRPSRLRFVVIELLEFAPRAMVRRNPFSDRAVHWHDAPALVDALGRIAASGEPPLEKLRLAWLHLRHAAWRASSFGRAERAIGLRSAELDAFDAAVAAAGGFEALDARPDPATLQMRSKFLARIPGYLASLEDVDRRNRVPALAPPGLAAAVRDQTAWLRAQGLEPIYLVPPLPWPAPELLAIAREPGAPAVVALNSPGRFPELFDPEHRWDPTHVNRAGAELLSIRLAAALAPLVGAPRD